MRILVCAKNDLAANIAVNQLWRGLGGHRLTLWLSDVDRPAELTDPDLAGLRFFERQLPKRWLWPLLDAAPARSARLRSFAGLAREQGSEPVIVGSLRDPVWRERLSALAPDLVISIRFSHIFKPALLAIPRHGAVNVHPGDLPVYAGLFSPFHQMMDRRESIGCTLHWIDAGIDTGPVLARRYLPVDPGRSLLWHVCNVYPLCVEPLLELVAQLARGHRPQGDAQDSGLRDYRRLPDRAGFERFRAAGFKLIDHADYEALIADYLDQPAAVPANEALLLRGATG